jgi:geranyl-CoA carboxylase alpha subunit
MNESGLAASGMHSLKKILVANRGEIACRIMRTARAMGFRTAAVFAEPDADAPHVHVADEAVRLRGDTLAQTYLNIDAIIDAARRSGADAVHPGYGFLSENAAFARACVRAGLVFIGPNADAIELMGNKRRAKIAMQQARVPCIAGYEGAAQDDDSLTEAAIVIGFPLMLKAAAGGGGRGLRLVHEATQLAGAIRSARSEALNAFGSGELIIEKAVINPRHIEIQVFADTHGNVVYLGERDCSLQRRHQKVLEEAPSPFVDATLRQQMGDAAVAVARACNYSGAGTVEFLVDADRNFFFLEMNTRLQVEHPVTELISGLDLVEWQFRVATGEPLPLTQPHIALSGHAIEVRLYAEDPAQNFLPQTGIIQRWRPAQIDGVRIDSGICEGQTIGPHYDPMLAKIIAYGGSREQARRRLLLAVQDSVLLGLNDNRAFLANVLQHPVFIDGGITTGFLDNEFRSDASLHNNAVDGESLAVAALLLHKPTAWHSSAGAARQLRLREREQLHTLRLHIKSDASVGASAELIVDAGDTQHAIRCVSRNQYSICYEIEGLRRKRQFVLDGNRLYLESPQGNLAFKNATFESNQAHHATSRQVVAIMDGVIVALDTAVGSHVVRGQTLAVMEAMKIQHELKAGASGIVCQIHVAAGAQVKLRQLLIDIDDSQSPEPGLPK